MQIHHLTLLTGNIPRSVQFYTEVLGFRFVKNSVNQENPKRRHVFYADYVGTPGTVITFIEVPRLGQRFDEGSYIQQIDYFAPNGSAEFWQNRLTSFGVENKLVDQILSFNDPDEVPIKLHFIAEQIPAKQATNHTDIPTEMQLIRTKNTNVYVPDLPQEEEFFKVLTQQEINNHQIILDHNQTVTLVQAPTAGKKRFGRGSFDHVALSATNIDEIHAIRKRGEEANYHFEKEIDRLYFYSIYFKDPFDNRVEFATLAPGFTADESLDHLGEKLGLPKRLEPMRQELLDYFAEHDDLLFKQ